MIEKLYSEFDSDITIRSKYGKTFYENQIDNGIFSRLNHRDNKTSYLSDIPRTFAYVEKVLEKYPYLTNIKSACHELEIKNLL